jgi:hypothetical protein
MVDEFRTISYKIDPLRALSSNEFLFEAFALFRSGLS